MIKSSLVPNQTLQEFIRQSPSHRILVVGDVMLDEYLWCKVSRISPEAPVPICAVSEKSHVLGGAANVAANILALGSEPVLVGVVGNDVGAAQIRQLLQGAGMSDTHLVCVSDRLTSVKTRIVAHHQHVVRVDYETCLPISKTVQSAIIETVKSEIQSCQALILSDYLKGVLVPDMIRELMLLAQSKGVPVLVDPKGDDPSKYQGATVMTPNFSEFQTFAKCAFLTESEIAEFGQLLIEKIGLSGLLVTRSEKGMSLMMPGSKIDIPTRAVDVFDITGAGDTVLSALAVGIANGLSYDVAAQFANFAAGVVVAKVGTATATFSEISNVISRA